MRTLTIGNVKLENSYILGPMAGVTDLPFRLLCKEQGAGLVCMEMVSAKGILYHNQKYRKIFWPFTRKNSRYRCSCLDRIRRFLSEMAKQIEERSVCVSGY